MKMILFTYLLSMGLVLANNPQTVIIDLKDYEKMKESLELPSVLVFEKVSLQGSFKQEQFSFKLSGRKVGKVGKELILKDFNEGIKNCQGEGLFTLSGNEVYFLPIKDSFTASCDLDLRKNGNFGLHFQNIHHLENNISDSESIIRKNGAGDQSIEVLRKFSEIKKSKGKVISNGKYHLTVNPNVTKFHYHFQFSNPNQNKEMVKLELKNGEAIESIESEINVKEEGKSLTIELNPGDNQIQVIGHLEKGQFVSPLESENQFFLIESHPLVQVIPQTKWRRISPSESGINPTQVNSKSYYISGEHDITWEVKKLNAFSSLGYSVSRSDYLFYVPKKGKGIVEASFRIDNKGTPEIPFALEGELLYAELDGQAIPMLKDDKNQLLVSMNQGSHEVKIQYRPAKQANIFATYFNLDLVKPEAVVSSSNLELRLDRVWNPAYGNFSSDLFSLVGAEQLSKAATFFILAFILFSLLKLERSFFLYPLIALSSLLVFKSNYAIALYGLLLVALIIRYRQIFITYFHKSNWSKIFIIGGSTAVIFFLYVFLQVATQNVFNKMDEGSQLMSNAYAPSKQLEEMDTVRVTPMGGKGATQSNINSSPDEFEGIPAKIQIPYEGSRFYFSTNLIDSNRKMSFSFLLFKTYVINLLLLTILGILGRLLYHRRALLKKDFLRLS
jgi:hypothetical protein